MENLLHDLFVWVLLHIQAKPAIFRAMNEEIKLQLEKNHALMEKIFVSTEQTRKYMKWTAIISLVLFFLPLVIIIIMLPMIINGLTAGTTGGF